MNAILQDSYTWVTLSFLVFLLGFCRYAMPSIVKGLDTRSDAIRSELGEAVRLRESAQALLADFQQKQKEMKAEAESILQMAKQEAKVMRKQAEVDLRQNVERRTKLAHENIARAEANAMADIQSVMVSLSVDSAGELLTAQLNEAQQQTLLDASLEEIKTTLH